MLHFVCIQFVKNEMLKYKLRKLINSNKYLKSFYYNIRYFIPNYRSMRNYIKNNDNSKLVSYKNKYKDLRCFIIGNGPSLKTDDLLRLKDEITFVSNRIFTVINDLDFIPTFYFAQDQLLIKRNIESIKNLDCTKFIRSSPNKRLHSSNFTTFYVNNKNYFNDIKPNFSSNISDEVFDGYTVTYSMLQFAAYMGFKEIYLLGIDANYSIKNNIIEANSYFNSKLADKDKLGGLPNLEYSFIAYEAASEYFKLNKIKVYNTSTRSKLNMFEKIDFDSIFED